MIGAVVPHLTLESFVGVISYLIGAAATFFDARVSFVLYALTPLIFITPPQVAREQR